jgi:4-hydroxy-tetrahydrodipicolinate reductase
MVSVLVNGAKGRMGSEAVDAVRAEEDLQLVGETDLGDDLEKMIAAARPDVVVDFTAPSVAVENTETILRSGAHPVVGTTGFRSADIERLQDLSRSLGRGGLIAPNFAIGAVLLMRFAAQAARYLKDVEVIELHHDKKLDAPSGTALKTIELIREGMDGEPKTPAEVEELVPGARGGRYLGIPVHSVRIPGLVAHEEVIFGGLGQTLTLRHDSLARNSFMPGVILAVRKVMALKELHYGLETILE